MLKYIMYFVLHFDGWKKYNDTKKNWRNDINKNSRAIKIAWTKKKKRERERLKKNTTANIMRNKICEKDQNIDSEWTFIRAKAFQMDFDEVEKVENMHKLNKCPWKRP